MPDDERFSILIGAMCASEEEAARVIEAFSRPMAGLILDGIMVTIARQSLD